MKTPLYLQAVIGLQCYEWTVISSPKNIKGHWYVTCRCSCGEETNLLAVVVVRGQVRSCRTCSAKRNTKHGAYRGNHPTATYKTWQGMRQRCSNPNSTGYFNYGGRGIRVCERWETFENFLADVGERPSREHTIDRIDPDRDYEPGNCRWATPAEQANNRRNHVIIEYRGERDTVANWARRLGVRVHVLRKRIREGWSIEQAFTEPVVARGKGIPRQTRR